MRMHFDDYRDVPKSWMAPFPNFNLQTDRAYSPDDGSFLFDSDFLAALQKFRHLTNEPCRMTSWYRSPLYNSRQKGSAPQSMHIYGKAGDIDMRNRNHAVQLACARLAGFTGIGLYWSARAGRFMHVDLGRARVWYGDKTSRTYWEPIEKSVKVQHIGLG